MHKIRRTARQHAWYGDGNETNFNPFGKYNGYRQTHQSEDLESASLGRVRSDNGVQSGEEIRRRSEFQAQLPPRNFTDISPTGARPSSAVFEPAAFAGPTVEDGSKENSEEFHSSNTNTNTSETLTAEGAPRELAAAADPEGPRKRKMGGLLGKLRGKDNSGEGEELERTTSSADKKKRQHFTAWGQIRATIFNSPINILLIAAPVGIALNFTGVSRVVVFVVNFIAIIPLAAMLSYATEEIALRTGETIGGLLNATFGNAVELIVSIIALIADEFVIVQTSLIGSMLSNLLLVMGMCFFFGGTRRFHQNFNKTVAQTAASLLALSIGSLIIPAIFDLETTNSALEASNITAISRGVSLLLLLVYACYLFFQLKTHVSIYNEPSEKVDKRQKNRKRYKKGDAKNSLMQMAQISGGAAGGQVQQHIVTSNKDNKDDDEPEQPKLSLFVAILTLAISTVLVAVCAEFLVGSIDDLTKTGAISKSFVGLILLPIVGNAAEHATAVTVAVKDKMDLAIGVAVGSSMQIALLVLPLIVIIGWAAGKPDMNLDFDPFQIIVLFVAVLLVNYLIADGQSHWLEGVQLMVLYLIIALTAWYYPPAGTMGNSSNVNTHGNGTAA